MFIVIYTKTGHFDGMTNSMLDKTNTLLDRDKWGLSTPFPDVDSAIKAFNKVLDDHSEFLLHHARAAQARQTSKSVDTCRDELLKIYPYPHSPAYHNVVPAK